MSERVHCCRAQHRIEIRSFVHSISSECSLRTNGLGCLWQQDTEILLGDIKDQQSIDAIARRTKVIIAMAGPYNTMGEAVVAACIKEGTHYVDITGG